MKTNDQDIISHKLDKLDTLNGGVVFGREDAWEKLQGRMDKKPARKVSLYYGAAAALVLFIACIFFFLRTPEQGIAIAPAPPYAVEKAPVIVHQPAAGVLMAATKPVINRTFHEAQPHTNPVIEQPEVIKYPQDEPTVNTREEPAIATASVIALPMRIVHINELDNELTTVKIATPTAALASKPMKVVTMSEILNDDYPAQHTEEKRTAMPLVKALFRQDQFASRSSTPYVQSSLNIKINLQN